MFVRVVIVMVFFIPCHLSTDFGYPHLALCQQQSKKVQFD